MGKNIKKKVQSLGTTQADYADKHHLYEHAVQCVEAEIDFVDGTFEKLRKRKARVLREDFCGTTNSSCEWVRRRNSNVAWSVDLDANVLAWGKKNHIKKLKPEQQKRMNVVNANVLDCGISEMDVVLAMNFSYWIFKQRKQMLQYFPSVYDSLVKDGVFMLDFFGGYEAFCEMEESTEHEGFTYVWDQAHYNPITGDGLFHIHFRFNDESVIEQAFTYEWRIWTLPEIREILKEAGFKATVYWEGTNDEGEGNGVFSPSEDGEADAGWIAYIVAEKKSALDAQKRT